MKAKGLRIIVIEDNMVDQLHYCRMAKKESYDITFVKSVLGLKQLYSQNRFDAVISKCELADGTAFDILEFINDKPLIFTAYPGQERIVSDILAKGAADYVMRDSGRNYFILLPKVIYKGMELFHYRTGSLLKS